MAGSINWDEQPLGAMPDTQLAAKLGVTAQSVFGARKVRGIAAFDRTTRPCGACGSERVDMKSAGRQCPACYPERKKKSLSKWRDANPETVRRQWRRSIEGGKSNRYHRKHYLEKRYGITSAEFAAALEAQGGCCDICKRPLTIGRVGHGPLNGVACQDHCHSTGANRGILCTQCNTSIGKMSDSPQRLRAAAEYLERWHRG